MSAGSEGSAGVVGPPGSHGHVAIPDAVVAVALLVVLDVLVLPRLVLLARDFVVRDFLGAFFMVVVAVVGVAVVVGSAARTTSVEVASRPPFGALCLADTVYWPAATDGRKDKAKRPSLFAIPVATVVPSSAIVTAEHRRDEQKPSPNAVVASPLATGFGATRNCAFVLLITDSALVAGTRHNASRCTTATANGRLAGLMACRGYSQAALFMPGRMFSARVRAPLGRRLLRLSYRLV